MPSSQTPNYNLNQWSKDDRVLMEDFNADNAKIDAALAGKADAAVLTALTQAVAGKGNCQMVYGQYTGNGQSVETNPITLTFEKKPIVVMVADSISIMIAVRGGGAGAKISSGSGQSNTLTWGEKSVSWTAKNTYGAGMNESGRVYYYIAFVEA
ncbi:hypothetical protein [uncultured Oscillibacter sp.]|uniref:hypothetical protein n=1 Tax=uncultured Oscillibacter sp. TaxID=876091 RepID=UPI002607EE0C|nr:hypothetical protein [uncultured Oscillibacter sp.]